MKEKRAPKGCIKKTRGPWKIKKTSKDGQIVTKLRFLTGRERQNSKQREHQRQSITRKIFEGLRLYGNYQLPKNAGTNDLLKALCEEAGWHFEEDCTIYKKESASSRKMDAHEMHANVASKDQDYSTCNNHGWTTTNSLLPRESQNSLKLFSNS